MDNFLEKIFGDYLVDSKINLPDWCKRVKIDVGTSVSAPNSELWLKNENDLCVFGFEPNKYNFQTLHIGTDKWPNPLDVSRIGYSFFCFNCAVSDISLPEVDFYCTDSGNPGTSSLFVPKYTPVIEVTKIPVIKLSDFFDLFPWDKINRIDQIKIDTQSSDFNVIKGMGNYLSEKVVYLDIEVSTNNQYENQENPNEIKLYLESLGFVCISWGMNAQFYNNRYYNILNEINYIFLND